MIIGVTSCCCGGCPNWTDTFDRADNDDPGPNWSEVSTDSDIDDNRLSQTSGALAICNRHFATRSILAQVDTVGESSGDVYRLVVNYADSSNYMFAEFCRNGADDSTLGLYKVVVGVVTELVKETILGLSNTARTFHVCLGSTGFQASISYAVASLVWDASGPVHASGYRAGLGNNGAGTIEYDNFYISKHLDDNPDCPGCLCTCGGAAWPKTLNAAVTADEVRCHALGDVTLTYTRVGPWWYGEGTICGVEWHLQIACPTSMEDAMIVFVDACTSCVGTPEPQPVLQLGESTCDPLYLVFLIEIPSSWLACECCDPPPPPQDGWIKITITE